MKRFLLLLSAFCLATMSLSQMPWPMERHDRWGSGTAVLGPSSASLTTPWVLTRLTSTVPVSHGPAIVSSSLAYYGDWINNKVYKFNPTTGTVYSFFQAGNFVQCSPAVGNAGEVYFCANGSNPVGRLFALNPSTMAFDWFFDTNANGVDDFHAASPTVGPDGDVVVPSTTGSVFRIHTDGSVVWTRPGLGAAYRTIVFSRDDTKVFVSNGTAMTALNYSDGTVAWTKDYGSNVGSPGVSPFGKLFFGTVAGNVYKVDPATGATLFTVPVLGEVHYAPAFSPGGSNVYFVANDGRLYSLLHSTGAKAWDYLLANQSITNAPIVGRDGRIYIYNRVGDLASVSTTGQQIWQVHMPNNEYGRGTMSIGADGTLYVGGTSDSVASGGLMIIRQQPQLHTFSTLSQDVGITVSGVRTDTFYSDNHYVIGAPTSGSASPAIRYTLTRAFPLTGEAQLWVWLESGASIAGLSQRVEFWDYTASAWVQADQETLTTADKLYFIRAPGAFTRFVKPTSGTVQVRLTYTPTTSGLGDTWQVRIDKASLGNVPTFGF